MKGLAEKSDSILDYQPSAAAIEEIKKFRGESDALCRTVEKTLTTSTKITKEPSGKVSSY